MQDYKVIPQESIKRSRAVIENNMATIASNFSGTAFPTTGLQIGMKCYRVDLERTYTLKSLDPLKWVDDASSGTFTAEAGVANKAISDRFGRKLEETYVLVSTRGKPQGVATLDESGKVPAAQMNLSDHPSGFVARDGGNNSWGNQNGKTITSWHTSQGGVIDFREDGGRLNVKIDGWFYQNEGLYKVVDESTVESIAEQKASTLVSKSGDTMTGNLNFAENNNTHESIFPSHYFHNLYENNDTVYMHAFPSHPAVARKTCFQFRTANGTSGSWIAHVLDSDGFSTPTIWFPGGHIGNLKRDTGDAIEGNGGANINIGSWNGLGFYSTYEKKYTGSMDLRNGNWRTTGSMHAETFYANTWFRAKGDSGFYFENHGGGWHMTDQEWIRAWSGKSIYTSGKIRCDGGFEGNLRGTATRADSAARADAVTRADTATRADVATRAGTADIATTALNIPTWDRGGNIWIA
jgi:hypothetical protein